jgi:hypothetical protein
MLGFFEWRKQSLFDAAAYQAVSFFDLTVCLWVCNGRKVELDSHTFTVVLEFLGCKSCSIICNDAMRDTKTKYD